MQRRSNRSFAAAGGPARRTWEALCGSAKEAARVRNASRPPFRKRKRELLLKCLCLRDQLVDDVAAMRFHPRLMDALSQKVKTMAQQAEQLRQSHQKDRGSRRNARIVDRAFDCGPR